MAATFEISASEEVLGSKDGFRFVMAEEKYWPAIMEHLREHYFREEVLCKSLGWPEDVHQGLVLYAGKGLTEGRDLCLVALEEATGKVVGVRIARAARSHEERTVNKFNFGPNTSKIIKLFDDLQDGFDLFQRYGVDEVLEFILVSVDRGFRRRGLATELILRNLRLAKKLGMAAAKGIFTSVYSQRVAEKLGLETVSEYRYAEYRGEDGELVFPNTEPHPTVKLMARSF